MVLASAITFSSAFRVSGENVGNYAIQQGGLGLVSANYDLNYQGNNLTITKALLNVIADSAVTMTWLTRATT